MTFVATLDTAESYSITQRVEVMIPVPQVGKHEIGKMSQIFEYMIMYCFIRSAASTPTAFRGNTNTDAMIALLVHDGVSYNTANAG